MPNERPKRCPYNGAGHIILSFQIYQVIDFLKSTLIYTAYIFLRIVKTLLTKVERQAVFSKTNI